jgi:pilus assembly protein CpaB
MRSKSIVLVVLAVSCGLVAAIGINQAMDARGKAGDDGDRQAVFVALTDVNANEELTAQNIKMEEWPKTIVPAGALTKLEEVEGKRCRIKLYAGEPILSSKLLNPNESLGAAKDIPSGYRVAYVKVDGAGGSSNLILPGDRVDVLVYRNLGNTNMNATAAKIVLQDIKVFAVDTQTETEYTRTRGDQSEPITAKTISLLVTPRQAEILHAATEMSGAVRLVLRNPDDDAHVASKGASIGDVFGPDQNSGREGQKNDGGKDDGEKDDVTNWLNQQKQTPPPAPQPPAAIVRQPIGPVKRMIVMYGSELMQVDFPGNGELPTNPMKRDSGSPLMGPSSQLTGGGGNDAPPAPEEETQDETTSDSAQQQ